MHTMLVKRLPIVSPTLNAGILALLLLSLSSQMSVLNDIWLGPSARQELALQQPERQLRENISRRLVKEATTVSAGVDKKLSMPSSAMKPSPAASSVSDTVIRPVDSQQPSSTLSASSSGKSSAALLPQAPAAGSATAVVEPKKPTMFIHIGPEKMATTFLQGVFSSPDNRPMLEDNGFLYIGSAPKFEGIGWDSRYLPHLWANSASFIFKGIDSPSTPTRMTREFHRIYNEAKDRKAMPIIVFEPMASWEPRHVQALADTVSDDFHVHIIAGYRRFYDFTASLRNQSAKANPKVRVWHNRVNREGEYGDHIEYFNFDSEYGRNYLGKKTHDYTMHPTFYGLETFRKAFPDATYDVINMEELKASKQPLMERMLCDIMKSSGLCQAWKDGKWKLPDDDNKSYRSDYDWIAFDAYKNGMITELRPNVKRAGVVDRIAGWQANQDEPTALRYTVCPPTEQKERLLQLSLDFEESDPLFWGNGKDKATRVAEHKRDFERRYNRLFCGVDTKDVLQQQDWIDFLKTLH